MTSNEAAGWPPGRVDMELRNPSRGKSIAASLRKWFSLAALVPISIVHRIALWVDVVLFPSLRNQEIGKPLFIVGLPRSGTTFLHRLVAGQPNFTTLPLWELTFAPALCEKYMVFGIYLLDRRIGSPGRRFLEWLVARIGGVNAQHPTSLMDAEEDFLGLLPFDGCFLRVLIWPYSAYSWQLAYMNDQAAHGIQSRLLKHYHGIIARHLYFRGGTKTLVSKNPSFTSWIQGLSREFPGARFIALRRTPEECVPSQLSAIRGGMKFFGHHVGDPELVHRFLKLLAHYWRVIDVAHESLENDRFQLIEYQELTESPYIVVKDRLQELGYCLTDSGQDRLRRMSEQGRRYRSGHQYSLAEFGLTTHHIRRAFENDSSSCGSQETALSGSQC